ncbi:hypothetical protein B0H15DRAFT_835269 [Mycena belliarum]|uniref:Uncharacterized protein n=1 Tax=Mycena belliarum TaxID=1033014 RepID=A0AAD6UBA4_9AGAR|nr:hypothetical protein B0H15DRAFT_835269 [Mycena belliae]
MPAILISPSYELKNIAGMAVSFGRMCVKQGVAHRLDAALDELESTLKTLTAHKDILPPGDYEALLNRAKDLKLDLNKLINASKKNALNWPIRALAAQSTSRDVEALRMTTESHSKSAHLELLLKQAGAESFSTPEASGATTVVSTLPLLDLGTTLTQELLDSSRGASSVTKNMEQLSLKAPGSEPSDSVRTESAADEIVFPIFSFRTPRDSEESETEILGLSEFTF